MELRQQMETRKRESKLALQRKNSEAERKKTKQVKERDFLDDFFLSLSLSTLKFFFLCTRKTEKQQKREGPPLSSLSLSAKEHQAKLNRHPSPCYLSFLCSLFLFCRSLSLSGKT